MASNWHGLMTEDTINYHCKNFLVSELTLAWRRYEFYQESRKVNLDPGWTSDHLPHTHFPVIPSDTLVSSVPEMVLKQSSWMRQWSHLKIPLFTFVKYTQAGSCFFPSRPCLKEGAIFRTFFIEYRTQVSDSKAQRCNGNILLLAALEFFVLTLGVYRLTIT